MIPSSVLLLGLIFTGLIAILALGVSLAIYGMVKEMTKVEQNTEKKDE